MSTVTTKVTSRIFTVTNANDGALLELGPAGTTQMVSTFMVQFNPDNQFNGQFIVMGRPLGVAADGADVPFVPIPYRRVSLADVAQAYEMVSDPINGVALIQIPANGLSVALLTTCTSGKCVLASWDLQGSSAV